MLIIETVLAGGIAAQMGLNTGDCLQAYNGVPLTSPPLLDALSENCAADALNSLEVSQQGQERTIFVPSGKLGLEVRPVLSPKVEALYQEGDTAWQDDNREAAIGLWQAAIHQSSDPLVVAWLELRLGNRYEKQNELQEALSAYNRAWEVLQQTDENVMQYLCLTECGKNSLSRSDLSEAQVHFQSALELMETAGYLVWKANCLYRLGAIDWYRGDLASMEVYMLQAFDILKRLVPDSLHMAANLYGLGNLKYQRGDLSAADDLFRRSLEIRERLAPDSLELAVSLNEIAGLYREQQHPEQALPLHQRALAIIENQRNQIVSTEGRSLLLAQHLDKYLELLRTYLALGDAVNAFAIVERSRARSLVEMLAERQLDFSGDAPATLLQREQDLNQQRAQIYSALAKLDSTTDDQQFQSLQTQLQELGRIQQQLTAQIRLASPRYAALQYPQPLDLSGVQAMLDPGTLALVYQTDETQTYLFAITRERFDLHLLPIGREQLEQKITAFKKVLDVRLLENTLKDAVLQGQELHSLLFAPAQTALKRAKRLLLCPEGPLLMLPFACLVTNTTRTPRYLGEQIPIHQTVSLTVYAQARQEKRERKERKSVQTAPTVTIQSREEVSGILCGGKRLLAMGDPRYARTTDVQAAATARSQDPEVSALQSRGLSLTPLPHTRQEVEGIGRLFGEQAVVHLDAEATKTIAKQESAHAAIIHFACHAWLDHRFPLSSALVLSQPELLGEQAVAGDNGLLQAWEVMEQMKLEADLVVLSACETGLGQEVRGEGLVGLTRAFQYAGASSVLASLWEINDASTSAFMQGFYEALVSGESKDVALQLGIKRLRSHPEWSHPYYWGAFALQGDWEA